MGSGGIIIICSNHMSGKGVLYAFYRHIDVGIIGFERHSVLWGKPPLNLKVKSVSAELDAKAAVAAISATMQATAKERKDFLDVVIRVPPF